MVIPKIIKVLVADDEALARQRIAKFLEEYHMDLEVFQSSTGKETLKQLNKIKPDLLFLDIKMTDMTGFDVLRQIPSGEIPIVIFVTAFDSFAVKAFEVQAIDFLLKPYKKERFLESLERGLKQLELKSRQEFQTKVARLMQFFNEEKIEVEIDKSRYLESIVLKKKKNYFFVKVNEILYIKSSGYYAEIYTQKNVKHIHRISMTHLADQLNPNLFSRVNRSSIVSLDGIKEVVSEGLGDFSLIMKDGTKFTLSKKYKQEFLNKMGIR